MFITKSLGLALSKVNVWIGTFGVFSLLSLVLICVIELLSLKFNILYIISCDYFLDLIEFYVNLFGVKLRCGNIGFYIQIFT